MARSPIGKVLLWVLGGLTALAAAAVLWFLAMLSGGWDEIFGSGPQETDSRVVTAVTQAQQQNRQELDALLTRQVRPVMGTASVTLARATSKGCDPGQHNWKRDDGYHLLCTVSDAVLVSGATPQLRDQMLALGRALADHPAWAGEQDMTLSRVVTQYWDDRARRPDAGTYGPERLPEAGYDGQPFGHHLHISWQEGIGPGIALSAFAGPAHWTTPEGAATTADAIVNLLTQRSGYRLLIEIERTAFQE